MTKVSDFYELLDDTVNKLSSFLANSMSPDGFDARTFYAEAFAGALWRIRNEHPEEEKQALNNAFNATDSEAEAHKEFRLYGLSVAGIDPLVSVDFTHSIKEKTTNWILLRTLLYVRYGAWWERWAWGLFSWLVLILNQRKDGLILDRRLGRMILRDDHQEYQSHQYHAFMLVILSDLFGATGWKVFRSRFNKGLNYMFSIIDESGKIVESGRGQGQIFGYASTIYVLAWHYNLTKDQLSASLCGKLVRYLASFQNSNGSFPLVMKKGDDLLLWESYNNLFDYLAFTALMLERTIDCFSD